MGPRYRTNGVKFMRRWATPTIRSEIPIDARGTGPMPHLGRTRR
jgi:hypothetical protein